MALGDFRVIFYFISFYFNFVIYLFLCDILKGWFGSGKNTCIPAASTTGDVPLLTGTRAGRAWERRSGSHSSQEVLRPLAFLPSMFCVVTLIKKACQAVFRRNILIM